MATGVGERLTELRGVEGQGKCVTLPAPALEDPVAGVAHRGVQVRPHRTEKPIGRGPRGLLQLWVPLLHGLSGHNGAGDSSRERDRDGHPLQ